MSADSPSGASNRLKSYKNKGLDAGELRRQREEEGIQLRKQKRDEQANGFSVLIDLNKNTKLHYLVMDFDIW